MFMYALFSFILLCDSDWLPSLQLQFWLLFNTCCCYLFICCNPKLGADGMRPLQHKVRDTFSVSKTVVRNDARGFYVLNYFFVFAGRCWIPERTCIYGWWPHCQRAAACGLLPSVTLSYDEQLLSCYAFIIHSIILSPHPCPQSAFSPTILSMVTKWSDFKHCSSLVLSSCQCNKVYTKNYI